MQSEFGPNIVRSSTPLLSELYSEYQYPSTKMLFNVHIKKHLNKKSNLKDFRLPETSENLWLFWLTTQHLLFLLHFVVFCKDKSIFSLPLEMDYKRFFTVNTFTVNLLHVITTVL